MFGRFYRKFRRNLQDHGAGAAVSKSLAYFIKPFYECKHYRLYKIELTRWRPPAGHQDHPQFHFETIDSGDQDAVREIEAIEDWLEGLTTEKLRNGGMCLVARSGAAIAGFNLVGFGAVEMPLINLRRRFKKNEAWSEQISVSKDFRRMGLAQSLRYNVFQQLQQRGVKRFYGGALASNAPSLKLAEKVGFKIFVEVTYRKFLGWKSCKYERVYS